MCYCAKIELSTTFDDDDKILICFCCWRVECSMVDEVDLLLEDGLDRVVVVAAARQLLLGA